MATMDGMKIYSLTFFELKPKPKSQSQLVGSLKDKSVKFLDMKLW